MSSPATAVYSNPSPMRDLKDAVREIKDEHRHATGKYLPTSDAIAQLNRELASGRVETPATATLPSALSRLAPEPAVSTDRVLSVADLSLRDRASLAAEIVERINAVREQHKRETGLRMPLEEAIAEWARRETAGAPVDGDAYELADLDEVAYKLAELGYSQEAIGGALADIGRTGTAQCSGYIDAEDKDAIEELIPDAPESAWSGPKRKGLVLGSCR